MDILLILVLSWYPRPAPGCLPTIDQPIGLSPSAIAESTATTNRQPKYRGSGRREKTKAPSSEPMAPAETTPMTWWQSQLA